MAESDASESSVLVDLSDQIDAEMSEEGGSICRLRVYRVQPYRHEPYRLHSDEEATENDQPELCDRLDIISRHCLIKRLSRRHEVS